MVGYLHFTLKMEPPRTSETVVSCHSGARCRGPEDFDLNMLFNDAPSSVKFYTQFNGLDRFWVI
jgi:hypothetical protein